MSSAYKSYGTDLAVRRRSINHAHFLSTASALRIGSVCDAAPTASLFVEDDPWTRPRAAWGTVDELVRPARGDRATNVHVVIEEP